MDHRSYSKRELKQIIDRALQMQSQSDQHPASGAESAATDHSLADLISVGRELGVDEELIRRAANEVDQTGAGSTVVRLTGGELVQSERRTVPFAITREQAEELTVDLDRLTDLPGQSSVAGRRVSWQSSYLASQQHGWAVSISVVPRGEQTVVEVEGRNGILAGGVFGGLVGGVGIGAGLGVGIGVGVGSLGSAVFAVAVPLAFLGASYALARSLYRAITRSRRRRLATVASRIREILEASGPPDAQG